MQITINQQTTKTSMHVKVPRMQRSYINVLKAYQDHLAVMKVKKKVEIMFHHSQVPQLTQDVM